MKYRKSNSSTQLVSVRIDVDTLKFLKRYKVNINAQINHYLDNLVMDFCLNDGKSKVFVYTK